MKTWARVAGCKVVELIDNLADGITPGVDVFTSDLIFVDATSIAGIAVGWSYSGSTFTAPPAAPPPTDAELLAYASTQQNTVLAQIWSFNVGTAAAPITLTTKLNASGQAAMQELLLWGKLLAGPSDTQSYNMADGTPGPDITALQAVSIAMQAGAVKSASFAILNAVAAGIAAGTMTTKADIDAAAWPAISSS